MSRKHNRIRGIFSAAICVSLAFCLCFFAPSLAYADDYWPEGPSIETPSAIVMEVNTGTVLYEKNATESLYPASITKIMTTLLAIENCDMDEIVTFSEDAVYKNEGDTSNIARDVGEEMTMEECLYAVMLESANECAYAVAEHVGEAVGGDYDTFISMMNERAKELGCVNTHFNNPNGLPDEEHWTCSYDMALIAAAAYQNETFRIITGTTSYTIPPTNKHSDPTYCHNHHKMIYAWKGDNTYLWDSATGGKTGYTVAAKNTLVTFAEQDGLTLVCVVMNTESPYHYTDTRLLMEYCFDNFQALNISENETSLTEDVEKDVGVLNDNGSFVTLDKDAYIVLPKVADFSEATFSLEEPEDGGSTLAKYTYSYAGREVGSAAIVASGATVDEIEFASQDALLDEEEDAAARTIVIRPWMIAVAVIAVAAAVLVIFGLKKLYDNYYVIRHKREVRREQKSRFRERRPKRARRRRVGKHDHTMHM